MNSQIMGDEIDPTRNVGKDSSHLSVTRPSQDSSVMAPSRARQNFNSRRGDRLLSKRNDAACSTDLRILHDEDDDSSEEVAQNENSAQILNPPRHTSAPTVEILQHSSDSEPPQDTSSDDEEPRGESNDLLETLFLRSEKNGLLQVTKNLQAEVLNVCNTIPLGGFPVSYKGHATFLDMRHWSPNLRCIQYIEEELAYCTEKGKGRSGKTSVRVEIGGESVQCEKVKRICTGVRVCSSAMENVRDVTHTGMETELSARDVAALCPPTLNIEERRLQRDINAYLWCNQNWRPCKCLRQSFLSPLDRRLESTQNLRGSSQRYSQDESHSGWRAIRGTNRGDHALPDFLGCTRFQFSFDRSEASRHDRVRIPKQYLDADIVKLNEWRTREDNGEEMPPPLPEVLQTSFCTVQRRNYKFSHCYHPIHGQHRTTMETMPCADDSSHGQRGAQWHIIMPFADHLPHSEKSTPVFAIVLGYGIHRHPRPSIGLSARRTNDILLRLFEDNPDITTSTAVASISASHNIALVPSSVRKKLAIYRRDRDPMGVSIQTLRFFHNEAQLQMRDNKILSSAQKYLKRVDIGLHPGDDGPPIMSIIFGCDDLLELASKRGVFALDGTFNTVEDATTGMGRDLEMTTITMKCPFTGRIQVPMRQVSNRKTTNSRMVLMTAFFTELKQRGMRGPLDVRPADDDRRTAQLSCIATDFEVSLLLGSAEASVQVFGKGCAENKTYEEAVLLAAKTLVASCDVHRIRFLLARCGNDRNSAALQACMGAVNLRTTEEANSLLAKMKDGNNEVFGRELNGGFPDMADWLSNPIPNILFFPRVHKPDGNVMTLDNYLYDTNTAEAGMNVLKKDLTRVNGNLRKGDLLTVLGVCFDIDNRSFRNTLASLPGSNFGRAVHTPPRYKKEAYLRRKKARRLSAAFKEGNESVSNAMSAERSGSNNSRQETLDLPMPQPRKSKPRNAMTRRSTARNTTQALLEEIREMKREQQEYQRNTQLLLDRLHGGMTQVQMGSGEAQFYPNVPLTGAKLHPAHAQDIRHSQGVTPFHMMNMQDVAPLQAQIPLNIAQGLHSGHQDPYYMPLHCSFSAPLDVPVSMGHDRPPLAPRNEVPSRPLGRPQGQNTSQGSLPVAEFPPPSWMPSTPVRSMQLRDSNEASAQRRAETYFLAQPDTNDGFGNIAPEAVAAEPSQMPSVHETPRTVKITTYAAGTQTGTTTANLATVEPSGSANVHHLHNESREEPASLQEDPAPLRRETSTRPKRPPEKLRRQSWTK